MKNKERECKQNREIIQNRYREQLKINKAFIERQYLETLNKKEALIDWITDITTQFELNQNV